MPSLHNAHPLPRPGTASLGEADRLLLWAFRNWIRGVAEDDPDCWSAVWNLFAVRFGTTDGKVAVATVSAMVRRLSEHARRPFVYHQPACGCLGGDEIELLRICILGGCGADDHAACVAGRFLDEVAVADFTARGARLARLFARQGMPLSDAVTIARVQPDEPPARPAEATLH